MTVEEFITELESREKVEFETGNVLLVPRSAICAALVRSLRTSITAPDEVVRYGVELSALHGETLTGELTWLLVLRRGVLEIRITGRLTISVEEMRVGYRYFGLARNTGMTLKMVHSGPGLDVREAELRISFPEEVLTVTGRFALSMHRAVLAASA